MKTLVTISLIFLSSLTIYANNEPEDSILLNTEFSAELEQMIAYYAFLDSIENTFQFEKGTIEILNGKLSIQVPDGYKYLNGSDSEMILTELWGNPPSEKGDESLGMLIPDTMNATTPDYSINITYADDGYIKDEDAKSIDYDELLESMIESSIEQNKVREELGYGKLELVGWAKEPFYDEQNKKLHWAKEFTSGDEINTLNYDIRVLGRKGYLSLNAISSMENLNLVNDHIDDIISSVNFTEGNTYSDFNPKYDKVAAYGIGGLIAGKVLAKAGIFAKLGIILAKFWKIIAVGFVAVLAGFRKFFGGNQNEDQNT